MNTLFFFFIFIVKKRYFKKSNFMFFKENKFFFKFIIRYRNRLKKPSYSNKKFLYWTIKNPIMRIFWPLVNYQIHSYCSTYFKRKFINVKYFLYFEDLYEDNLKISRYKRRSKEFYLIQIYKFFLDFTYLYNYLFNKIIFDSYKFVKKLKKKKSRILYRLLLTFRNNKMFINFSDKTKINYLFISTGLFIKYFEKKKLFKKSKIIRTIMAKYLRKLFLLLSLPRTILILKKNPVFFLEFLNLFNQPIPYKFHEPFTNREVFDTAVNKFLTKFLYFIFLNTQNYTNNKTKKRGRVKRKIFRKIVLRNAVID